MTHQVFFKGLPGTISPGLKTECPAVGLNLLNDDLPLPIAVLKKSALENNEDWMTRFCTAAGVSRAPHGKTTMSPELIRRQMDAGVWAMTAATAHHVRLYADMGVRRVIMANQLVGAANLKLVYDLLVANPELEFFCLVDDPAGAEILAEAWERHPLDRPVKVLLELGGAGGRAGVRNLQKAKETAAACARYSEALSLAGVEAFEAVYKWDGSQDSEVLGVLDLLVRAAEQLDAEGLFSADEIILTAGGSAYFDLAAKAIKTPLLSKPSRMVLRSGCYIAHDSQLYEDAFARLLQRTVEVETTGRLMPALEVWGHVQSRPESDLIIVSVGKRDISSDSHPPKPIWHHPAGSSEKPLSFEGSGSVVALYDQHACVKVPSEFTGRIGDLVGFGVSHPCTTFDKWQRMLVVEDNYTVCDWIQTRFG